MTTSRTLIENPVINSPVAELQRPYRFPAVNNHGEFDRWAFLEIEDLWDAQQDIRTAIEEKKNRKENG